MSERIREVFETEGTLQVVGGNTPVLLDGSDNVWFIGSGKAEIFSVETRDGQPTGRRYHFFTARSGQPLFGMNFEKSGEGVGFLAVGLVGTRLFRLAASRLHQLAKDPALAEAIAGLVDPWVSGLSYGISKDINPRTDLLLEPGQEVVLEEGKLARSKKGIVWVRHLDGNSMFIGMEELYLENRETLFPVSQDTWLQPIGAATFSVVDTKTAVREDASWTGLEVFYDTLFKCEFFNTRLAAVDEFNRLKEKADKDLLARRNALAKVAAILEPSPTVFEGADSEDPLAAACALVGQALGFPIRTPPKPKEGAQQLDPLGDIARGSRVGLRKVLLRGDWWQKDNGPLLGFLEEDNRPVALLPISASRYECRDPTQSTVTPVTAENESLLKPVAYVFYRSFPDRAIGVVELLKFGSIGTLKDYFVVILMGVMAGALAMITPMVTGRIFDTVIPGADRSQMLQLGLALFVGAFSAAMFELTKGIALLRAEGRMDASIQAAVWDRLLGLPAPFFRRYSAGDLAVRADNINEIRQLLSGTTMSSLMGSVFSLFNLVLMLKYDRDLALLAVLLVLVLLLITYVSSYFQLCYQRHLLEIQGRISGLVLQLLTGISKIRIAGAENRAFAAWAKEFSKQASLNFKVGTAENVVTAVDSVFPIFTSMVVFAMIAFKLQSGMSTGTFLAFYSAFGQFQVAVLAMNSAFITIVEIVPLFERTKPILLTLPEVELDKTPPGELSGAVELGLVTFRYKEDGPLALDRLSMQIKPGEFVAFVGPSGAGKSTIMRLLLGFEKPETGTIYYDGQDLSTLDIKAVRRQIGTVLQNSKLVPGDIFTNIIGASPLTMEEAWEAARLAGLDGDINQMPMGMQTYISEGGGTLSGGQRQRLMIARAIVNKPRIIFFDEATSALDNQTQAVVSRSLESLQATRIVIAHRLSTIMHADRVFVVSGGRVVQSGTYDELMSQEGLFQELASRQIA